MSLLYIVVRWISQVMSYGLLTYRLMSSMSMEVADGYSTNESFSVSALKDDMA